MSNIFNLETAIVFGTFGRQDIANKSLSSLIKATEGTNTRIVVADSSPNPQCLDLCLECDRCSYLWTPGKVSMAASRNIAVEYIRNHFVSEWLLFVEDDLVYKEDWYSALISSANTYYGTKSPLGLAIGIFTASPLGVKKDENSVVLEDGEIVSMFGPRADQRLFKTNHYFTISREWENDLLGISSAQTGKIINRSLMRGYCALSIGHLGLCDFIEEEESTWEGIRDIGPAAFDKRPQGYASIIVSAKENFGIESKKSTVLQKVPMTSIPLDYEGSPFKYYVFEKIKGILKRLGL